MTLILFVLWLITFLVLTTPIQFAFTEASVSSINSFGYSPHPFSQYLVWIEDLLATATKYKPIIVSMTSDIDDAASLTLMLNQLQDLRQKLGDQTDDRGARIAVELNTSCPNIQDTSPPGYDIESLNPLLQVLFDAYGKDPTLTIGLKLPPLVHEQQFHSILDRIQSLTSQTTLDNQPLGSAISFLTCTNTLGNSLLFSDQITSSYPSNDHFTNFALPTVLGGLAGEALHPLALGNVYRFSKLLKESNKWSLSLSKIKIIGVGGVTSKEARRRMEAAGADAVACATFFGKEGITAFETLSLN
jgi:dihydroorotate dehydrogenase (fumarate)